LEKLRTRGGHAGRRMEGLEGLEGRREEGGGRESLDGTGAFSARRAVGALNFIDVARDAIRARTIEPGSVCEGGLGQG